MNLLVICLVAPLAIFTDFSSAQLSRRIVGGYKINIKDAPYQVALIKSENFDCGGSLLSQEFVLSAAHC
jgi:secreted trypsin-like serine protease